MTLGDILLFLGIFVVGYQFWRIRGITEQVNHYLKQYCDDQDLQLISVARQKSRLTIHKGKLDWHNWFDFEFSGNGEDSYVGEIEMKGIHVNTQLPPYRV